MFLPAHHYSQACYAKYYSCSSLPRLTIRSYEIAVFPCSEEKRYIFETIIFIRSKYEPLALMTQRDTSIDIFYFYKIL